MATRPETAPVRRTDEPDGLPAQEVEDGIVEGEVTEGVRIENLSAWFGDFEAVKSVSLGMAPRRVTAIIGPSGCGKTTLIRCLNRMHELVRDARISGRLLIGGRDIYAPEVDPVLVRRRVGMVFQRPNPFPTMSIYDNVAAGLRLNGLGRGQNLDERVELSLEQAALFDEVKDRLRQPATRLSGGQQQRLCIARALAIEPEVLLFDEPTSALDPVATEKIEALLYQLKERYTIAIVTHSMQQAARVSDDTGFMLLGELVEFDRTERMFTRPSDPRTEAYITGRFG